jgi:hypothetical protein
MMRLLRWRIARGRLVEAGLLMMAVCPSVESDGWNLLLGGEFVAARRRRESDPDPAVVSNMAGHESVWREIRCSSSAC